MKGKIHRASVTQADLHYEGSISIDWTLLDAAGFLINERVEIYNIETGARFATYVIEAPRGSGTIGLNGAAARLAMTGDKVIIVAYTQIWVVWVRLFQLEHPTAIVCQSQKYPLCISVDHFWPVEIGKPLDNRGFSRFPTESHPDSITPSKTDERGPITLQMATIKECRSRWLRVQAAKRFHCLRGRIIGGVATASSVLYSRDPRLTSCAIANHHTANLQQRGFAIFPIPAPPVPRHLPTSGIGPAPVHSHCRQFRIQKTHQHALSLR